MAFSFGNVAIAKATRNRSADSAVLLSVLMTGALALWDGYWNPIVCRSIRALVDAIVWFGVAGILVTVWGRITLFKAIQYAGVLGATALRRITPFVAVLFGWLFLAKGVSGWNALGLAFIGVSFGLLYKEDSKKLGQVFEGLIRPLAQLHVRDTLRAIIASSYLVRKWGLELVPNAYLGALI